MTWIVWALLLIIQNASFTLVSRARQSYNYWFHAIAAGGSNGIWFTSQLMLVASFMDIAKTGDWMQAVGVGLFYVTFTIVGSVGMHYISAHSIEKTLKVNDHKTGS